MDVQKRKMYLAGGMHIDTELAKREKVCAIEIWVECLNGDLKHLKRADSTEINGILSRIAGWKRNRSVRRYGPYGVQKGFERV